MTELVEEIYIHMNIVEIFGAIVKIHDSSKIGSLSEFSCML